MDDGEFKREIACSKSNRAVVDDAVGWLLSFFVSWSQMCNVACLSLRVENRPVFLLFSFLDTHGVLPWVLGFGFLGGA